MTGWLRGRCRGSQGRANVPRTVIRHRSGSQAARPDNTPVENYLSPPLYSRTDRGFSSYRLGPVRANRWGQGEQEPCLSRPQLVSTRLRDAAGTSPEECVCFYPLPLSVSGFLRNRLPTDVMCERQAVLRDCYITLASCADFLASDTFAAFWSSFSSVKRRKCTSVFNRSRLSLNQNHDQPSPDPPPTVSRFPITTTTVLHDSIR
ncbi:hypothetical protein Bbelb_274870 [Branchiostoma belcheri]|nr:hypothetical protein Bbelb_274870 [Branchiostoma belcheri]